MFVRYDIDKIKKIEQMTFTDYDCEGDLIPGESITNILDDLLSEIETKETEIEELKRDIEDNYRPITKEEEIGFNYRDFI